MDSLALVRQPAALAVFLVALHHVSSLPYRGRQTYAMRRPYVNNFQPYVSFYQQFYNPFRGPTYNMPFFRPWAPRPVYIPPPFRPPLLPARNPWAYSMMRARMPPKVIAKKKIAKKQRISVIGGPLSNVVPYPSKPISTRSNILRQKKKARMHMVAKAQSFPGILKNTALDVSSVGK